VKQAGRSIGAMKLKTAPAADMLLTLQAYCSSPILMMPSWTNPRRDGLTLQAFPTYDSFMTVAELRTPELEFPHSCSPAALLRDSRDSSGAVLQRNSHPGLGAVEAAQASHPLARRHA
jgi:hypothetical protein